MCKTEPTPAIAKILDVEETELTFRHRQPLTMEDFAKAREEYEEMCQINEWALKLAERIIDSKYEKTDRLSLLAKSYMWMSAT